MPVDFTYDLPMPLASSSRLPSSPKKHHRHKPPRTPSPHVMHKDAADVARILDPSYATSTRPAQAVAYIDAHGDLHDPDYRHFPVLPTPSPRRHRYSAFDDSYQDEDDDEDDEEDDGGERRGRRSFDSRPSAVSRRSSFVRPPSVVRPTSLVRQPSVARQSSIARQSHGRRIATTTSMHGLTPIHIPPAYPSSSASSNDTDTFLSTAGSFPSAHLSAHLQPVSASHRSASGSHLAGSQLSASHRSASGSHLSASHNSRLSASFPSHTSHLSFHPSSHPSSPHSVLRADSPLHTAAELDLTDSPPFALEPLPLEDVPMSVPLADDVHLPQADEKEEVVEDEKDEVSPVHAAERALLASERQHGQSLRKRKSRADKHWSTERARFDDRDAHALRARDAHALRARDAHALRAAALPPSHSQHVEGKKSVERRRSSVVRYARRRISHATTHAHADDRSIISDGDTFEGDNTTFEGTIEGNNTFEDPHARDELAMIVSHPATSDPSEKQDAYLPSSAAQEHDWTPTCGEALRREWQAVALRVRFALFRAKRRVRRRLGV
ncbi:hypothetical protein PLICRDRAFT_54090 [Plicaturopsis crispa FD-325 SS-3]|nr:hypothetical protein PLICRDRAFT_54090 [Plicaturopsis crispa FD-325 SS-3]